ncbi:20100_t:CDS:1, partial [Racocetra persica]
SVSSLSRFGTKTRRGYLVLTRMSDLARHITPGKYDFIVISVTQHFLDSIEGNLGKKRIIDPNVLYNLFYSVLVVVLM